LPPGAVSAGELVAALKELGFDLVLDITTAADLTICEEGTELLHRLKAQQEAKYRCKEQKLEKGGAEDAELRATSMPLFTSCCPGWLQFVEKSAPELTPYISSCKSPHLMYGAILKAHCMEMFGTNSV
jgi:iron only hydrogenase large subunit-like protein